MGWKGSSILCENEWMKLAVPEAFEVLSTCCAQRHWIMETSCRVAVLLVEVKMKTWNVLVRA